MTLAVTIVCQLAYPELVSTGLTITELAEGLAEQGVQVTIVAGPMTVAYRDRRVPKRIQHKGVTIHRVWGTQYSKLSTWGKAVNQWSVALGMGWYVLTTPIKGPVFCISNPPFLHWIVALMAKIKRYRWVAVVFDVYPDALIASRWLEESSWLVWGWRWLNRWAYGCANRVVVIGRCMAKRVQSQLPASVWSRIIPIHVWADDRGIAMNQNEVNFRERWELGDDFIVGYSGNLARFHDVMTLVRVADLMRDVSGLRFLIVGEGAQKQAVMAYCRDRALSNVLIHSYVPREELGSLLHTFDVGVVSLETEFVGISVPSKSYGLMAAGVPVLGLLPEESEVAHLIRESGCGWVIPPHQPELLMSALKAAMQDAHLMERGQRGLELVRTRYSLGEAVLRYIELIKACS